MTYDVSVIDGPRLFVAGWKGGEGRGRGRGGFRGGLRDGWLLKEINLNCSYNVR